MSEEMTGEEDLTVDIRATGPCHHGLEVDVKIILHRLLCEVMAMEASLLSTAEEAATTAQKPSQLSLVLCACLLVVKVRICEELSLRLALGFNS